MAHPNFDKIIEEITNLHKGKSNNYATDVDAISNFRKAEKIGVPIQKAIMCRMIDKWERIINLYSGKNDMVGEDMRETMKDLVVLGILWMCANDEK